MKREGSFLQWISEEVDLPGEPLPRQSFVEIAGTSRVLIENHFGVKEYNGENICVRVNFGCVLVCGKGLGMWRMTKDQLIIRGRINSVTLLRSHEMEEHGK